MQTEALDLEQALVFIIANAGDSKSSSLEAIEAAKEGDFEGARQHLDCSGQALRKAHNAHTSLLSLEAKKKIDVTLLMVHASNHLSIAEITQTFASEIVSLYKK